MKYFIEIMCNESFRRPPSICEVNSVFDYEAGGSFSPDQFVPSMTRGNYSFGVVSPRIRRDVRAVRHLWAENEDGVEVIF